MKTVDSTDGFLQIFHPNCSFQLVVCMRTELYTFYLKGQEHLICLPQNINSRQANIQPRAEYNAKGNWAWWTMASRTMQTRTECNELWPRQDHDIPLTQVSSSHVEDYARRMSSTDQTETGCCRNDLSLHSCFLLIHTRHAWFWPFLIQNKNSVFIVIFKLTLGIQLYSLKRLHS